MSKLYNEYLKHKNNDSSKIYMFKSGIFYIALNEDAKILSNLFDFKIIHLNENVVKCGFPVVCISKYSKLLKQRNINFSIVDEFSNVLTFKNYLDNINLAEFIEKFNKIDVDYLPVSKAYELLYEFKNLINEIKRK